MLASVQCGNRAIERVLMSFTFSQIRNRLEQHSREEVGPNTQRVWASVALIIREADGDRGLELMFIRRAKRKGDPWSGHMAFPGGREEPKDPSLLSTSMRETLEEVGVDLHQHGVHLGTLDDQMSPLREAQNALIIRPHVFQLKAGSDWVCEPNEEVSQVFWFTLTELWDPLYRGWMPYEWKGQSIRLPIVQIGEADIWGLSLRMLDNFSEILDSGAAC